MIDRVANGESGPPRTLVELLRNRAFHHPDKLAYIYLRDGESDEVRITYAQLDRRARSIAASLQSIGASGERALLLYPPGLDYLAAYFGCLYAGVVAVPAYPPRLNRPSPRIQRIVADAQATLALTVPHILEKLAQRFEHMPELAALRWVDTAEIPSDLHGQWREPQLTPETLAFLQYTSGSTSAPKGVMVSHGNLMHNLEMIRDGFQIDRQGRGVFWLPSYHDMGLIGGLLEPMYVNGPSVIMDPAAFLQRPVRWLQALMRYEGTISGAPNFAYQMCVDKVTPGQCADLDLSRWRIAFCGAEPIRARTLADFAEKFAPYGFRADAFYPCYGMAESTLLVSGGDGPARPTTLTVQGQELEENRAVPAEAGSEEARTLVSCGHTLLGQQIVIADPHSHVALPEDRVGEIWVAGPSVAQGYWGRPQATERTFQATLGDGQGPFLRTGDLGFLHEGQLYVTGRLKDLIIIRGRNHYPQDIERTVAESHPAFEMGMGAAFSAEVEGQERLVVTYELKRSHRRADVEEVTTAARRAIAAVHGLQPYAVVLLKPFSTPRTSSGKIRRHACRQGFLEGSLKVIDEWRMAEGPVAEEREATADVGAQTSELRQSDSGDAMQSRPSPEDIEVWLMRHLAAALRLSPQEIDPGRPFVEFGLDSVQAVSLTGELEAWLGRSLSPTLVWDYPTIRELSAHLAPSSPAALHSAVAAAPAPDFGARSPVAIIGLSCRFPGAGDPDAFWRLLRDGIDAIGEVPLERWDVDEFYDRNEQGAAPGKMNTRWGGFLDAVDRFDPHFFGISPREAQRMDPQQRLLLEVAWEALERAGQAPGRLAGSHTGVFVGISSYDYSRLQLSDPQRIDAYAGTGNAHSVAANRLSYALDLRGPSVAVDTACSSSLVATHLALQSLRSGESDMALAGGVNLILSPELTIIFSQARMMAADGRCKTFDASADGYVRGEGAGIVVLKRLEDALRDGDPVLAVLYGSAVNQDGRSNGLTAPNGPAQQAVIRRALSDAGATAAELSYVEAHGTGTSLGDPIEVQSLGAVLEGGEGAPERCYVGSVKTNVGHLEAAAGIAGLIKVVLALQNEEIPPHLHFKELNPYISLDGSPLVIAAQGHEWPRSGRRRLAGVSSFGFGGTNAHVVLGDALLESGADGRPELRMGRPGRLEQGRSPVAPYILPLSARSERALGDLARRYLLFLREDEEVSLPDVCYTAGAGRDHFEHRAAFIAGERQEMIEQLERFVDRSRLADPSNRPGPAPRLAFLFTGQGAQYRGMARRLYETQPLFRAVLDRCDEILREELDESLLAVVFGEDGDSGQPVTANLLDQTAYTQPALFAVEYALAQLWRSWGVVPDVVMGHSVGEYVAACVAGVFSLEDGLRLVAARGRLMQDLPQDGSMAVVFAGRERVLEALAGYEDEVDLAAVNGPQNVTLSGRREAVARVVGALQQEGIETRALNVSHAFHSPLMAPMLDAFQALAGDVSYQAPQLPLVSNVSGRILAGDEVPDATYWREHVRRPVDFAAGVQALVEHGTENFLEIGPQPHLLGMARRIVERSHSSDLQPPFSYLPSLRRGQDHVQTMLQALGALYEAGLDVHWPGVYEGQARRVVALPTYPFQRERYWLDVEDSVRRPIAPGLSSPPDALRPGQVRRLPTALPLYEAHFTEGAAVHDGPADGEGATFEALARQMLQVAAGDRWGEGAHEVQSLLLEDGLDDVEGPVTVQLALTQQDESQMVAQLFRLDGHGEQWHLCGSGQVRRREPEAVDEGARAAEEISSLRDRLLAAADEERVTLATEFLRSQAAQVLGLATERLDPQQGLYTLGIDSLMAIELRNRIERELEVTLPVVEFLQGPSVSGLAGQLVAHLGDAGEARRPIAATVQDPYTPAPLAYEQQAMWFLHQLLPEEIAFNVAGAVRLQGPLDVPALRRALQGVIARHAVLRTTFRLGSGEAGEGMPLQQVQVQIDLPFREVDATAWEEAELRATLEKEAHRPFDLQEGPPLRMVLLRREKQEHVLLLAVSHIVADFWSMSLLVQELYQAYAAETAGVAPDLPAPELQYIDYVAWQREMLGGPRGEGLRRYWQQQLSGELPLLDLPTDRPRPAQQTFRGDTTSRRFNPQVARGVRTLAQEHGATLATTLLAGFQALLHRYTGQEDVLVGSVLSGRERPELARVVGYFLNPVALRADLGGDPSFADLLQQTRQTVLEAFEHQEYPLPLLAEQLSLQRDAGRPPLVETMFIMQKAQVMGEQGLSAFALGLPGARMELGELSVESLALGGLPAQFDLTLMMAEVEEGLAASLHYNTALFDAETAGRMLAHLEMLLKGVVADPRRPLARIPLLADRERRRLLQEWNRTEADFPGDRCLHHLVEEQAERTPHRVAVVCGDDHLTFQQLDRRANQVAQALDEQGVGPGDRVAIALRRSLQMPVALLGALKAGAAYVPLDPAFPASRLALMVEDAQPRVLISEEALVAEVPAGGARVICLDTAWPAIAGQPDHAPGVALSPEDVAYVIYTSGSTGRPKGVQIPHRAAVNFLSSMRREPGLTADDVLLAVTTLSFDISVLELFLPLIAGAQVVIAPAGVAADGAQLAALLDDSGATVMQATPATWRMLLAAGWEGHSGLKILCGGEALPRDLADALLARSDQVWNMYGPTETTVWSTTCRVQPGSGPVSIGRPIANTQIYIVDGDLQPVPVGVAGELYIGGAGVARGYLNRPQLTAEKFIPAHKLPFLDGAAGGEESSNGQSRRAASTDPVLYKTGDLARYRPGGDIHFLGRRDHQVKVRGYRIELGDVEAALARHEAVRQAVVVARGEGEARRLVGYVLLHEGQEEPAAADLRRFLRHALPDYMIPSAFVTLERLPLTPNNKVDRRALPEPPQTPRGSGAPFVAPRTELERELAQMCAAVLDLPGDAAVGVEDSFFDLGGNSLLATRLIFQVRQRFQVQVPLRRLFAEPTVSGLARAVEEGATVADAPGAWQMSVEELNAEVVLDESIDAGGREYRPDGSPQDLFLTGATGFLGAFLLHDLLRHTQATVHCLVRAADEPSALARLRRNLQNYRVWDEAFAERIMAVPGDLARPRLGLDEDRFARLAQRVDAIYHNGALVNFVYPYAAHKAVNVLGTQEVLRLAAMGCLKPVHFVSTLSVFHTGEHDDGTVYRESDELDDVGAPFGGYAQSKWVAEKVVMTAAERGIPVAIYRPGMVSGHSESGSWNTEDMMTTLARASLALGVVPDLDTEEKTTVVDVVPVDYVSRAIVELSQQPHALGQTFHLNNPSPLSYEELLNWARSLGVEVQTVPFKRWREKLMALALKAGGNGAAPFLPLLEEVTVEQVFMPAFDCRNTLQGLADGDVACPPVGPELLRTYLAFFERQGFLRTSLAKEKEGMWSEGGNSNGDGKLGSAGM